MESGKPCLVRDFNGNALSFSQFNLLLAIRLLYIPVISKIFFIEGCWILSNAFFLNLVR